MSTDTPKQLAAGRGKHNLSALMLSDRELIVTDLFGLRNKGTHSGMPGGAKALPVPTSILVDDGGRVLWMDQSEHYQQRSNPDYLKAALEKYLG